ncbi:MAG: LPS-assembly protein LptD [Steroidobacteraceae bacterium]
MLLLIAVNLGIAAEVNAQVQTCPGYDIPTSQQSSRNKPSLAETAQLPIELQADSWDATVNGEINLNGQVTARQGERTLSADALHYDLSSKAMKASGAVQYEDNTLQLGGADASMDSSGGTEVAQASFILKANAGRGTADKIQLSPEGNVALESVRYTTCPVGSTDWELKLSDLNISQQNLTGTGRNVRLEFQGVPIFYLPWISFPVGNERKSGFLFPTFGGSSRGGNALSVPWYWNLAANYDDTITPIYDTSRGFKLDNEFRYLGESSKGSLVTGYLPHDNKTNDWRGLVQLAYRNDFDDVLRLDVGASDVRDNQWFEDFGQTLDATSTVYLPRSLSLNAYSSNWQGKLKIQNLQVIDDTIPLSDRPYTLLPQLSVAGHQLLPFGWEFTLDSELSYFTRGEVERTTREKSLTGGRLNLVPELTLPLRTRGLYLTPSASWHYTGYQLQNTTGNARRDPSLSAPAYSLDSGMVFERLSGSKRQRLYTLEPRLLYTYVPYRSQDDLPLFDTGMPDFNLVQLFQTNRFIGPDRLGDTNQLSAGLTTRMLDARDGRQFLAGTVGQAYYFRTPCVISLTQTACNNAITADHSSDIIGQLSLSAYKNWTVSMGIQWDPNLSRGQRGDFSFQYRPAGNQTINLGYSYNRGSVEQWVSSFAWPIGRAWSSYGRVVYSHLDRKFLDHFAGLEYRSCCWNIRAVVGRAVTTRSGEYDTQYKLQLELKGLSSVGTADAFLESSIPGYSARAAGSAVTLPTR